MQAAEISMAGRIIVLLDLLINEIHLGYVIYGKTRNVRGLAQLVDKEDWIKVKGTHEPLKTEAEHELILVKIAQNNIIPKKTRNGALPLSGLLYCAKCGRTMQYRRTVTKNEIYWSTVCVHTYPDGSKCDQKGRKLDSAFYHALYSTFLSIHAIGAMFVKVTFWIIVQV
ncbi:MAG: hypothetical protein K0Q77_1490 [Anaerosporomusa subterranea]|jgi:hypothetical protein|nr:hypothetical protein [Anaerosporomusa subterranea]